MRDTASHLLTRAQTDGTVRDDLKTDDLLALATGIALTSLPAHRLETLLDLVRHGYLAPGRREH
jgi:Transcriptional regulator SbtR-like, C-terminal domain